MVLNFSSTKNPDDYLKKEILRYITITFSVFCEYLVAQTERVQKAASAAMRIIISNGLNQNLFQYTNNDNNNKTDITEILSLDALTISEEVGNIRNDRRSRK